MSRRNFFGLMTAVLVAIAMAWMSRREAGEHTTAPATDTSDASEEAPAAAPAVSVEAPSTREASTAPGAEPPAPGTTSPGAPAAVAAVVTTTTTAGGYSFRAGTDERMPRHSGVSELRQLSRKAVKRAAERERERALLEDREVLEYARRIYEFDGAVAGTDTGTVVRAAQLEVFAAALAIPGNPQRELLRETLAELAVRRVDPKFLTEESRREIATDRVVIFRLLRQHFPETAQKLRAETREERLQKLLDYAASLPPDAGEGA